MSTPLFLRITPLLLTLLLVACETGGPDGTLSDVVFPSNGVSYSAHVLPFFEASCAFSGCHDGGTTGVVSFLRYIDLFSRPGLVHPGDSAGSVLCQVLSERLPHSSVPIALYATLNQRRGVSQWVQEGALNN